jgi:hypothetical protein
MLVLLSSIFKYHIMQYYITFHISNLFYLITPRKDNRPIDIHWISLISYIQEISSMTYRYVGVYLHAARSVANSVCSHMYE